MRNVRFWLAVALLAVVPVAAFAAGQGKASTATVTVGDFAVMLAKATGTKGPIDASAAASKLSSAGVPIGDYRQPLNERKLTEIMDFYGVSAKTAAPDKSVTQAKAQSALTLMAAGLQSMAEVAAAGPSPQSLDDCLTLANHGQCTNCCKALGGSPNTCAKDCFVINKPSAGEPLP